ncbi:MAG: ThiF family adenylyltransferase [Candidatus Anstonellaceae archaeon]
MEHNRQSWFSKNLGAIDRKEQELLFKSRVLICGVGGVGGICIELLARAGVEKFAVIDNDKFEITNLNRQIHSNRSVLGQYKVDVIKKQLKLINPKIKFYGFKKRLEPNMFNFYKAKLSLFKPQIIIDSFDNASSRMLVSRLAKKLKIPHLYAGCAKARGFICLFSKEQGMEICFDLPSKQKKIKTAYKILENYPPCPAAWGPITNLVGCLASNIAINFLLKKEGYPTIPYYWVIEGKGKEIVRLAKF